MLLEQILFNFLVLFSTLYHISEHAMLRYGSRGMRLCQGLIQGIWKGGSYIYINFKIIFLPILELFSAVAHSKMPGTGSIST